MKTITGSLASIYGQTTMTVAVGCRVVRKDGQAFGRTDFDENVTIDGLTYYASMGFVPTATHTTNTLTTPTMDITVFMDDATEAEIVAEIWDGAEVTVFEYDWSNPPTALDATVNILRYGNLGQIKRQNQTFVAEIRGLTWRLSRSTGRAFSPTCPWRHAQWNGSTYVSSVECGLDLTSLIFTGTITAADTGSPSRIFTDSASDRVDGYYAEGLITLTSGDNAGLTREVRLFASKQWTLYRPFPFPVAVGTDYKAVIGDDKTKATCKALGRFVSFGGFPDIPGIAIVFTNPVRL